MPPPVRRLTRARAVRQVGIIHTSYKELSKRNAGLVMAGVSEVINAWLCGIHCHKARPAPSATCRVHAQRVCPLMPCAAVPRLRGRRAEGQRAAPQHALAVRAAVL